MFSIMDTDAGLLKGTKLSMLYSCDYSKWSDDILAMAGEYKAFSSLTSGSDITGYRRLRQDVYETVFENGKVIVNYSGQTVNIDGHEIGALDYLYVAG